MCAQNKRLARSGAVLPGVEAQVNSGPVFMVMLYACSHTLKHPISMKHAGVLNVQFALKAQIGVRSLGHLTWATSSGIVGHAECMNIIIAALADNEVTCAKA